MYITKGQKKILIMVSIAIVLFVVFWIFIYMPASNSVKILKAEFIEVENKINNLESIIGKNRKFEEGFFMLQEHLDELDNKFPVGEEETLRLISKAGYACGIDINSIKPQPKKLILDENENVIKIDKRLCQKMPISLVVKSKYKELGNFLENLREDIPHLLTVERVKIVKGQFQTDLDIDIDLTMYLLIEEE